MKVKELADLTGTTTRAIRHYHHVGLLPVPDNPGVRDYGLDHAVRVVRIRALADSGLALSAIQAVLEGEQPAELAQQCALAVADIDRRIAELEEQKARLREIRRRDDETVFHVKHGTLLDMFYDRIEQLVPVDVLPVIRRERQAAEVLFLIPGVRGVVEWWIEGISEERLVATANLYTWFAGITELPAGEAEEVIARGLDEHRATIGGEEWGLTPRVWRTVIPRMLRTPGMLTLLYSAYPHPNHQLFIRMFLAEVDDIIEHHVSRETSPVPTPQRGNES